MPRGSPAPTARRPRGRCGTALLDVLLAMVLLAVGGVSLVVALADAMHTLRSVRARDAEVRAAAAELSRVATWSGADLVAHSGSARRGVIDLVIAPVAPGVYHVAMAEPGSGTIILQTSLYRPVTDHDTMP